MMNKHTTRGYMPENIAIPSSYVALAILHEGNFHLKATKLPVSGSYGSPKLKADYEFAISNVIEEKYHPILRVLWMNVTSRHTARHAWDKKLVDGWKVKR
jgi:hypothetical protein